MALSFVQKAEDVQELKDIVKGRCRVSWTSFVSRAFARGEGPSTWSPTTVSIAVYERLG